MLARRAANEAFDPMSVQLVYPAGPGMFVVERVAGSGRRALVAVNLCAESRRVRLPSGPWFDSGRAVGGASVIEVGPWSSLWLDSERPESGS